MRVTTRASKIALLAVLPLLFSWLPPVAAASAAGSGTVWTRVGGADRYATASAVSKLGFPTGASAAVVASGELFPDGLSASYVAGQVGGPVLLTPASSLPAATLAEVTRLHVSTVYVAGGTGAVSTAVEDQLAALRAPNGNAVSVVRLAGDDRYATAAAIATRFPSNSVGTVGGEKVALLASGTGFADALAGSAAAAGAHLPMLLTGPDVLSPQVLPTLALLGVSRVVVLGGTGAISAAVATQLTDAGLGVTRLGGADRVATATLVASWEISTLGFAGDQVVIARGDEAGQGVDALSAGAYIGHGKHPLLLAASPSILGGALSSWLGADTSLTGGVVVGGPGAINDSLMGGLSGISGSVAGPVGTSTPPAVPPALAIATSSLTGGTAGLRYLQPLDANGGTPPYAWSATGLPDGLTLTSEGILAGTPTATGTASVDVQVTDGAGTSLTRTLPLAVPDSLPAPCVTGPCSIVTPDGSTVALAATSVVSIARDAATGAVNQIVINTTPPAVNQILAVEPTPDAPSGLVARVDAVTDNGDGTTTLAVTPGTPADAYADGTVKAVDSTALTAAAFTASGAAPNGTAGPLFTRAQSKTLLSPSATLSTNALAASKLSCTGGVTSDLHGLSVDQNLSPQVAAIWKHPLFGGGGFYVGTGGLELFQFDLAGTITVNLGVAVSDSTTCTLKLPKVVRPVPAGALGAVILTVAPTLTLEVTGKIDLRTSVTLTCGTEYRWYRGTETRASYCHAKNQPLQLSGDSGVDDTLTGALDASVTLDEIAGITGNITAAAHAGYHPTGHPVVQIDAKSTFNLGACLACFWKGSPAHVTLVSGTLFDKVLYTSDTTPTPTPLAVTTSSLAGAVVAQPYAATLAATGGTAPLTWSVSSGTLPAGLSLSSAGSISGTPSTPGTSNFTVAVRDSAGVTAQGALSLSVITGAVGPGGFSASRISAGTNYSCAITTGGAVKCWGGEVPVMLLNATFSISVTPVDVAGLGSGVAAISAGTYHACVVTTAGAAQCWGDNTFGQLGNGTNTGATGTPVGVYGLGSGVAAISAGYEHTCALTTGGAVKCWGDNTYGQLGNGTNTGASGTPVGVYGLGSGVAAISAGSDHTCALTSAGAVKCWGFNSIGQLGDGTTTSSNIPVAVAGLGSGVAAVAAGSTSCALTTGGAVKCWGNNPGDGTNGSTTPVAVAGLGSGVAAISTGDHACALTTGGAVRCWGHNGDGELGNGTTTDSLTPVGVVGLSSGVAAIAAGSHHSCAVTTGGAAKCWGGNPSGELGNGTTVGSSTPVGVIGLP